MSLLYRILSSIEGYKIELEKKDLSDQERECLEKLVCFSLSTAKQYKLDFSCYDRWFDRYNLNNGGSNDK